MYKTSTLLGLVCIFAFSSAQECSSEGLDLIFLLDGSGSISSNQFEVIKTWTKQIGRTFDISDGSIRLGVIQYSFYAGNRPLDNQPYIVTEIPLGRYRDQLRFEEAVDGIRRHGFTTFTAHALNKTAIDFMQSNRFLCETTTKAVILVTDGRATDAEYLTASASYLRSLGIVIFSIGVGDASVRELQIIATGTNSSERVYYATNVNNLFEIDAALLADLANLLVQDTTSASTGFISNTPKPTSASRQSQTKMFGTLPEITTADPRPTSGTRPDDSTAIECSSEALDLIFLLDGSNSIGSNQFEVIKTWTKQIGRTFDISDGSIRLGVIQYSFYAGNRPLDRQTYIITEIPLGRYRDQLRFEEAVDGIRHHGFTTHTAHALNKTAIDFMQSNRFLCETTTKAVILVTDGRATDAEYLTASASYLRSLGIVIFSIGVGDASVRELQIIATGTNSSERVYYATNVNNLFEIDAALLADLANLLVQDTTSASTGFISNTPKPTSASRQSQTKMFGTLPEITTADPRPTSGTRPDDSTAIECSSEALDLIFLLDGSNSIGSNQFEVIKTWTKQIGRTFDISDGSIRLGVIQYSFYAGNRPLDRQTYIITEIPLGRYRDQLRFEEAVDGIRHHGFTTHTAHALNKTAIDFMQSNRFLCETTTKAVILVTDGRATDAEYLTASASYLRSLGIVIFSIGVGDASVRELQIIATGTNSSERVYYATNVNNLFEIDAALLADLANLLVQDTTSASTGFISNTPKPTSASRQSQTKMFGTLPEITTADPRPTFGTRPDDSTAIECSSEGLDLIFLLDGSESISSNQFEVIKTWIKQIGRTFDISDGSIRLGVIQYSHIFVHVPLDNQRYIVTEIPLGRYRDHLRFEEAVDGIRHQRFTTYTAHALNKTAIDFMQSNRFLCETTTKAVILVTDGKATDAEYLTASASYLRSLGIVIFSIGVGDASVTELQIIATGTNSNERVYYATNVNNLLEIDAALLADLANLLVQGQTKMFGTLPEITTADPRRTFGTRPDDSTAIVPQYSILSQALDAIARNSETITNSYYNWFSYLYDGGDMLINDGGRDMFDGGNNIIIQDHTTINETEVRVRYNQSYRFQTFMFDSYAGHPFVGLLWVENDDQQFVNLSIRVFGNLGADSTGSMETFSPRLIISGNYQINAKVFQVYNAGDPTVCEVYFTIFNYQDWNSVRPDNFDLNVLGTNTDNVNNIAYLSGRPRRIMMGYTLLSRYTGEVIRVEEIRRFLLTTLESIKTVVTPSIQFTATVIPTIYGAVSVEDHFDELWRRASLIEKDIFNLIPSWHEYAYDGPVERPTLIRDGRNDMYDVGNMVKFYEGLLQPLDPLFYDELYRENSYIIRLGGPVSFYPFMALAWITDQKVQQANSYTFQVNSNFGADGNGKVIINSGFDYEAQASVQYHSFQIYDAGDATVCEVYFIIMYQDWNSTLNGSFDILGFSSHSDSTENSVRLSGRMQNILMGYVLLSSKRGNEISDGHIRQFLRYLTHYIILGSSSPSFITGATNEPTTGYRRFFSTSAAESYTTASGRSFPFGTSLGYTAGPDQNRPLLVEVFNLLRLRLNDVASQYSQWHSYDYDGGNSRINDGGHDMFDGGNMIDLIDSVNNLEYTQVTYNQSYSFPHVNFLSYAVDPFFAFLWIENDGRQPVDFTLKVIGNPGSDGSGLASIFNGSISSGNFHVDYAVFQISNSGDPTICEVYFIISSEQEWNSIKPDRVITRFEGNTRLLNNAFSVVGRPRRIMVGYTLLSRYPSRTILDSQIQRVLHVVIDSIKNVNTSSQQARYTTPSPPLYTSAFGTDFPESTTYPSSRMIFDTTKSFTPQPTPAFQTLEYAIRGIDAIRNAEINITSAVSNWYPYLYDGDNPRSIVDGGRDMYDVGNTISVFEDERYNNVSASIQVFYNQSYSFDNFEFSSFAGHPFFSLLWIKESDEIPRNYTIRVFGDAGADFSGYITRFNGSILLNDFQMEYIVFQVSGTRDPTICEVYFTLYSSKKWQSIPPLTFGMVQTGSNTNYLNNFVTIHGTPSRMVMGYTLLSNIGRRPVTEVEVYNVMVIILNALSSVSPPPISPCESRQDDDFLPSCSVKHAINAVFRCEQIFAVPTTYRGPLSCRKKVDEAIRCVGNQLAQCRMGGEKNKLDSLKIPNFDSKTILSFLYNLIMQPDKEPNREINTFCFHAGLGLQYPHSVQIDLNLCDDTYFGDLLNKAKDFYYAYAWARNRTDICSAFTTLKQWLLEATEARCKFTNLFQRGDLSRVQASYLNMLATMLLHNAKNLESSSCSDFEDHFALDGFGSFGCISS